MTIATQTLEAFRYWRQRASALTGLAPYLNAADALARARAETAEGKARRYTGRQFIGAQWGASRRDNPSAPFFVGEDYESIGFRFVGFVDEVSKAYGSRAIEHNGWYTNEFQDETLRGAVFQIPGHKGESRFVGGYLESMGGGYLIDPEIYSEPRGDYDNPRNFAAAMEAARAADSMAERAAEKERDYQEAWQAGSRFASLGEEVAEARKAALAILRERRILASYPDAPAARAAICDRLAQYLESIRAARAKREELVQSIYTPAHQGAFIEGAGLSHWSRLFADSARDWRPA